MTLKVFTVEFGKYLLLRSLGKHRTTGITEVHRDRLEPRVSNSGWTELVTSQVPRDRGNCFPQLALQVRVTNVHCWLAKATLIIFQRHPYL